MARPKSPIAQSLVNQALREKEVHELIHALPHLTPHQPIVWDFTDNKQLLREGYRVIYLSDVYCKNFLPYINEQFLAIKLINLKSPAHKISYYDKHKYWVIKDEEWSMEKKVNEISGYIDYIDLKRDKLMLRKHTRQSQLGLKELQLQLEELNQEKERWLAISGQLDQYELVQTTYYSNYRYWYISWKFQVDINPPQFSNDVSHLLSPIRDSNGQIVGHKLNIIFVNIDAIQLKHDYQHKEIDLFLEEFPLRSAGLKRQLFARKKPTDESGPTE